jgi:isopentenyl phosphate kinase
MQTIFLKLGGSLITEKNKPFTPNISLLNNLAVEIASSYQDGSRYQLIIGHGSGSFGHQAAKQYGTRDGVTSRADWFGFLEVWKQARALNQIVLNALTTAGLPVLSFPPVSAIVSRDRKILSWDIRPIRFALEQQLVPVIYGDVVFDQHLNGTILSTEELFLGLSEHLPPNKVYIAGIEPGVWKDYPVCTSIYEEITPQASQRDQIHGSSAVDVTGGMAEKVNQMINLVQLNPAIDVQIFSGTNPAGIRDVLDGKHIGTRIHS